ncbi:MAG: hypothetical protein CMJ83_10475 [Planctomycetes bacterium]|nr:hypothetical protein [Planctomycetota bacterium]
MILGRGQILGTFAEVSEMSAAFASTGEARLALSGPDANAAVATLIRAIHERVDMDIWVWGYGDGPDELANLSEARARLPGLASAFEGAGEHEIIALLALLAHGAPPATQVLPQRAQTLFVGTPASGPERCVLALRTGPEDTAHRLQTFRSHGGPDLPIWATDRTLGVRFRIHRDAVTFRAHHPVIQEELERRCEQEGIDLA